MFNHIHKLFSSKKKEDADVKVHVGKLSGSYDYFHNFKKKHPTYETIVSDYLVK